MIEGLWTGEWDSTVLGQEAEGAGVFIFRDGRIFGGSARYYFFGEYELDGERVSLTLQLSHYSGPPSGLLGPLEEGQLSLAGTVDGETMTLQTGEQDAAFSLAARLVKRAGAADSC